jgi:hypothetical protein
LLRCGGEAEGRRKRRDERRASIAILPVIAEIPFDQADSPTAKSDQLEAIVN